MSSTPIPPVQDDPGDDGRVIPSPTIPAPPTGSGPTHSPDGRWFWNGQQWTPAQTAIEAPFVLVSGEPARGQGMAVASLVLGILSPIFAFIPVVGWFFVPIPIGGLVLGVLGMRSPGRGKAIAGIVLSLCGLALDAFWFVLFLIGVAASSAHP